MEIAGYRIDELIGRGGMGVVYRAEHVHLRRTVALKVLAPEVADTEGFRERFVHESRVAAGIDHPSIVTVYDAGEVDGQLYLAMRYIEGSDLASALRNEGRLSPDRALDWLEQVASALDAAHAHGLVHRDVKPGNVLLQGERAYLTDFGLTKRTEAATAFTATGQFVGTIDYVAPEQIRGADLSPRTDVYALGCVLHECLTGARPFARDTDVAVLYAHLEEPPPRPSAADLPPALDPVLACALAKDPAERQASCSALIAEARAAMTEPATEVAAPPTALRPIAPHPPAPSPPEPRPAAPEPTAAEPTAPVSAPTRALRERRSRRPAFAFGGVAALAAVAAAVVILAGGDSDEPEREQPGGATQQQEAPAARVAEQVDVGAEPAGVAVRDGTVWVANAGDDTVSWLDAETGEPRGDAIPVGSGPHGVTVGRGSVFVTNTGSGTVSQLSAPSGQLQREIEAGSDARWVALGVGDDSLWVSNNAEGTVSRVNLGSGQVVDEIEVGSMPRGIGTTERSVWVANFEDDTLTRIDVASGQADAPVETGSGPEGIAIRDGVVWVANNTGNTVTRHNNRTGAQIGEPIAVGDGPYGIWVGDDHVWVTTENADAVTVIDPDSGELVGGPVPVGATPAGVREESGAAWVAIRDQARVVRLEPTR